MTLLSLEDLLDPQILRVSPSQTLADLAPLLSVHPTSSVCILVTDNQQLLGILTPQHFPQLVAHSLTSGVSLAQIQVGEVMTSKVLTLNADQFPGVQDILCFFQQYNLQYLPVLDSQGQPQGVISQTRLLNALARQQTTPSVAPPQQLEQEVRLRTAKLAKRMKRKRLLAKIALRIHESLDLKTILSTTIAEVRNFLDCDRVLIYRLKPGGGGIISFEAVSSADYSLDGLHLQDECFECEHSSAYQRGYYRAIKDIYTAGLSHCHLELLEKLQIRANLVLPILNNGELWGLLSAQHCQSPKAWQSHDISFLQELVIQVEIAIQQANLVTHLTTQITKQKQAQLGLHNVFQQERELNVLKDRLVMMTSHLFRTPLTTILGTSELLKHYDHKLDAVKKAKYFNRINNCVNQIIHLLDEILLLGRTEDQQVRLNPVEVDLLEFCNKLVAEHNQGFQLHNRVFLNTSYQQLWVSTDRENLYSILEKLLSNGLKYSGNNDLVELELTLDNNELVFRVRDQGIGIPPADLDYIFEYFYHANNVDPNISNGLGLAIVKNCVQLSGGNIWVHSELGRGTTFTVTIPTQIIKVQKAS